MPPIRGRVPLLTGAAAKIKAAQVARPETFARNARTAGPETDRPVKSSASCF
jgi:hypothetical protein